MLREGAAASTLRRQFLGTGLLEVPQVHWSHTRRDVLVLDRIEGIPVDDVEALREAGFDLQQLAERGAEIFFTQVFRHNFFHADLHPGNIFVSRESPHYIAVDFGIMGSLGTDDQRYLAGNLFAFLQGDYREVAELHVASGWVPSDVRVEEFESAIRAVCEPIVHRPLKDISFAQLLVRLIRTARRFEMEVQPQLVLLQKTLLHIEGLARQLYPDFDLWATGRPILEEWMRDQASVRAVAERVRGRLPRWMHLAPELPELVHEYLKRQTAPPHPRRPVHPPGEGTGASCSRSRGPGSSSRARSSSAGRPTPWACTPVSRSGGRDSSACSGPPSSADRRPHAAPGAASPGRNQERCGGSRTREASPRKAGNSCRIRKVGMAARYSENRPLASKRRRNPDAANRRAKRGTSPPRCRRRRGRRG